MYEVASLSSSLAKLPLAVLKYMKKCDKKMSASSDDDIKDTKNGGVSRTTHKATSCDSIANNASGKVAKPAVKTCNTKKENATAKKRPSQALTEKRSNILIIIRK